MVKKPVTVHIDEELIVKVKQVLIRKHGKYAGGILSRTFEEALKLWLEKNKGNSA